MRLAKAKPLILGMLFSCIISHIFADESIVKLESVKVNTHDLASIQKGAKNYAKYCLTCHALDYMEHDPIAKAAGITPDKMPDKNKNWWFGTAPPSLTLITKIYSPDWLYTYLHTFYKDPSRPTGANNLLLDNVNMPSPFVALQGEQRLLVEKTQLFKEENLLARKIPYYSILEVTHQGIMSADDFDEMVGDLINFLIYAAEPKKYTREMLGIGVLVFVAVLTLLVFLLKRSYWKKLHTS